MSGGLASVTVDVRGLNCPIPLLKTRKAMAVAAVGASVTVLVTDPDSVLDIRAFAQIEGFPCEVSEAPPGVWCFRLSKP